MLTIKNIDVNKKELFELYESGKTIGTFQTESSLCRCHGKRLKPKSLIEVSNLIAAVRPGVLESCDDEGVTMMERYRLNINKLAEPQYIHPCMEQFLRETSGVMLYQEQMMQITEHITNFDAVERHRLLKAVSKKNQEEIAAVETLFINSSNEKGVVSKEDAAKIYLSFKASGRYLFNKSHSVGYAIVSCVTAHLKKFYGVEYFCAFLEKSPKTDLRLLINDARSFGFKVIPPTIADVRDNFHIVDDTTIRFGFSGIQGCGAAQIEKIRAAIEAIENTTQRKIGSLSWLEFLAYGFYIADKLFDINAELPAKGEAVKNHLSKSVIENLIKCGALDCFKQPRSLMLHELRQYKSLSPGEKKWMAENVNHYTSLVEAMKFLRDANKSRLDTLRAKDASKGASVEKRYLTLNSIVSLLEKPPVRVKDSVDDILIYERELLSVAVSATKLDKYYSDVADTTIKEYLEGKNRSTVCIKCEISRLKTHEVKNPRADDEKDMAFITLIDDTGEMDDCVIFTKEFRDMRNQDLDYEGAQVLVWGEKDYKKGGFILKRVRALA